ncbi:Serine/Threonine kinase catalytic domain protein [Rhizoctonia solani AG-3 Rhs1AP]|nr:Serine/Threonine kinase catalytic domain protein [Rhizoctonia solani AG-3 Rhs1AP]KEP49892.1 Serine/Threonine kinase catalytic domain protein [Rhizoctonia solani 123E]
MAQVNAERPVLHSFESEQQIEAFRQLEATLDQPFHFADPLPSSPSPQPAPFAQYTPLVGRTITSPAGPQYRLAFRRVLGVGAYGVVYLAEQVERDERQYAWGPLGRHEREQTISSAGRMYAVKVMRCAPKGSRQRAFQAREVALHRKADGHPSIVPLHAVYGTGLPPAFSPRKPKTWSSHSNIVRPEDELTWDQDAELSGGPLPLLETGQEEELVYMVLTYVGGGDLFSMIAERQRYIGDDALVRSVFTQLLDAVQWCHIQGVRHRDLKPENILCEEDGRTVFVSDFGLATADRHSRDFGCGSSYYMSPECYGDPVTPITSPSYNTRANDVWTLGVVLVNLTTGRNPWEAASPLDATFKSYCEDPANFLPTILPITPAANKVLIRVFEQDQTKRISIPELREMVSRVERWTLRGHELEGASEGARDVARGCGLLDLPLTPIRGGSSGMAERSRFSEDTLLSSDEDDDSSDGEVEWYAVRRASVSSISLDMNRSRPLSKILSNSPTLMGQEGWGGADEQTIIMMQDSSATTEVQDEIKTRPESTARWPKIVQGWGEEQSTPRAELESTPRCMIPLRAPRSTPSLRQVPVPFQFGALLAGSISPRHYRSPSPSRLRSPSPGRPSSPLPSKIPVYTGSRTRTVSFDPPRTVVGNGERQRMKSAPASEAPMPTPTKTKESNGHFISRLRSGASMRELKSMCSGEFKKQSFNKPTPSKDSPDLKNKPSKELKAKLSGDLKGKPKEHDVGKTLRGVGSKSSLRELSTKSSIRDLLSTRELKSKTSFSTLSVASSESNVFPVTPLKAEVILASPRVIVSHPSDGTLWDGSRTSGTDSAWEGSSTAGSHETHTAVGLEPGAPLYDRHAVHRFGEPFPSSVVSPRYARKRTAADQKVKRVPVPPIPSELLAEHERQLTTKRNGNGPGRDRLYDSVAVPVPVPEVDDEKAGPKRSGLLDNARAWFRRI